MKGDACRGDKFNKVSADRGRETPNSAQHAESALIAHLIRPMPRQSSRAHGARNLADLIHDGPRIGQMTVRWKRRREGRKTGDSQKDR